MQDNANLERTLQHLNAQDPKAAQDRCNYYATIAGKNLEIALTLMRSAWIIAFMTEKQRITLVKSCAPYESLELKQAFWKNEALIKAANQARVLDNFIIDKPPQTLRPPAKPPKSSKPLTLSTPLFPGWTVPLDTKRHKPTQKPVQNGFANDSDVEYCSGSDTDTEKYEGNSDDDMADNEKDANNKSLFAYWAPPTQMKFS